MSNTSSIIQRLQQFLKGENGYVLRHRAMQHDDLVGEANPTYSRALKGYKDPIENRLYPPVDKALLAQMKNDYPDIPETLWELYQVSDGLSLFAYERLPHDQLGGFFFLPMEAWIGIEHQWLTSWVSMFDDEEEYDVYRDPETNKIEIYGTPPWWNDVLILGGFEAAPERFYLPTTGEFAGNIFMFQHDEHSNFFVADNIDQFLALLADNPADLLYRCGGNFYYDMIGYGDDSRYTPISKEFYNDVTYE